MVEFQFEEVLSHERDQETTLQTLGKERVGFENPVEYTYLYKCTPSFPLSSKAKPFIRFMDSEK